MKKQVNTLEELEGNYLSAPHEGSSNLVLKCYLLRRKILNDFSVEDLRIMISQKQGIKYLVPIALDILLKNPFAEGDFYEGDLLANVLRCDCRFWRGSPENAERLNKIIIQAKKDIDSVFDEGDEIKDVLLGLIKDYENCR